MGFLLLYGHREDAIFEILHVDSESVEGIYAMLLK